MIELILPPGPGPGPGPRAPGPGPQAPASAPGPGPQAPGPAPEPRTRWPRALGRGPRTHVPAPGSQAWDPGQGPGPRAPGEELGKLENGGQTHLWPQIGPIKVPRPVPGSIFHETDTRNLILGVPGTLGAKIQDLGLGGGGPIWEFLICWFVSKNARGGCRLPYKSSYSFLEIFSQNFAFFQNFRGGVGGPPGGSLGAQGARKLKMLAKNFKT